MKAKIKMSGGNEFLVNVASFEDNFKKVYCEAWMEEATKDKFLNLAMNCEITLIEGICGKYMVIDVDISEEFLSKVSKINFSLLSLGAKAYEENYNSLEAAKEQPTVPIQFVWHDGCLYHEDSCRNMSLAIEENCTVEQIGAVLYVRSE